MTKYENQDDGVAEYYIDDESNIMYNIPHYYCDECRQEFSFDELFLKDNQCLCKYCLSEKHTCLKDIL